MEEKKIELFIPGELKDEPIIFNMIKNFQIDIKIIEASFSAESGWALLIVGGKKQEIDRMLDQLKSSGITVEIRP